ncbi:MAG: hypothetical protein ACRC6V_12070 [Bacteroidales bacterium]
MPKELNKLSCQVVFDTVFSILGESTETIKYKYIIRRASTLFFNTRKELGQDLLEIRFKKERITLLCVFGESRICNAVYLFLDYLDDLKIIADFLDQRYPNSICINFWLSEKHIVSIETTEFDFFIKIVNVPKTAP